MDKKGRDKEDRRWRIKEEGSLVGMDQTRWWFSFFFYFFERPFF
jgi:hypothetical protein